MGTHVRSAGAGWGNPWTRVPNACPGLPLLHLPAPHNLLQPLPRGSALWSLRELYPGIVRGWLSGRVLVSQHIQKAELRTLEEGAAEERGAGEFWGGAVTEIDGPRASFSEAGRALAPAERSYGLKYTV